MRQILLQIRLCDDQSQFKSISETILMLSHHSVYFYDTRLCLLCICEYVVVTVNLSNMPIHVCWADT